VADADLQIQANTPYVASYYAPTGHYASNGSYFTADITHYPITALGSVAGSGNGVYKYSATSTFPSSTYNSTNYWVDVDFSTQAPDPGGSTGETSQASATLPSSPAAVDAAASTGTSTITPTTSSWSNAGYPATVGFAQAIEPQSLHLKVTAATGNEGSESPAGTTIAGTVQYNPATFTASFRPDQPLPPGTTYHAVATAVAVGGTAVAPISWTFTTVGPQPAHAPLEGGAGVNGAPPPVVAASDPEWARRDGPPLPEDV